MIGRRFGNLLVTGHAGRFRDRSYWDCLCDCGKTKRIYRSDLLCGKTRSCGCLRVRQLIARSTTHGHAHRGHQSPEYKSWANMIQRCTNHSLPEFKDYGGRGITVCKRWLDFENFLADMGRKPSNRLTIERIENAGNYEPANCRWATRKEQNNNKRSNVWVESEGRRMRLADWAVALGLSYSAIHKRFTKGTWPK